MAFVGVIGAPRRARFAESRKSVSSRASWTASANQNTSFPKIYLIVGGPGCGKGTQCERLAENFGLTQVTMGDLLRAVAKTDSLLGSQVQQIISRGDIVPGEITMQLLQQELEALGKTNMEGVLLDGFPRNMQQMIEYEKAIGRYEFALYFDCHSEILRERLLRRSETSTRSDDNEDVITVRINNFRETAGPLLDYFEQKRKLVRIDATGNVDQVFHDTRSAFEQNLAESKVSL